MELPEQEQVKIPLEVFYKTSGLFQDYDCVIERNCSFYFEDLDFKKENAIFCAIKIKNQIDFYIYRFNDAKICMHVRVIQIDNDLICNFVHYPYLIKYKQNFQIDYKKLMVELFLFAAAQRESVEKITPQILDTTFKFLNISYNI